MKNKIICTLMFLICFAASWAEAAVINPSFELFTGTPGADGGLALPTGTSALTGWNIIGGQSALLTSPNTWNLTASDGENFLDLTGYTTVGAIGFPKGISQTLTGLTIGQSYSFYVDLGISNNNGACTNCGGPVRVTASVGSTSETFTHNSSESGNIWGRYGFDFVADSTDMGLTIIGISSPGIYLGLDNVSVTPVPLPAAFWLLLSGAAFLFYSGRRHVS